MSKILRTFGPDMAMRNYCGEKMFKAGGLIIIKHGLVVLIKKNYPLQLVSMTCPKIE